MTTTHDKGLVTYVFIVIISQQTTLEQVFISFQSRLRTIYYFAKLGNRSQKNSIKSTAIIEKSLYCDATIKAYLQRIMLEELRRI